MGGVCGTYEGEEGCRQGFGGETLGRERDPLEGLGEEGGIILQLLFKDCSK